MLIVICLLVVIIALMTKAGKGCLSGITTIIGIIVLVGLWKCNSCTPDKNDPDYKQAKAETEKITGVNLDDNSESPAHSTLTKADTIKLRKYFTQLTTVLTNIHVPTVKASNQFNQFCNLADRGEVSSYEVYEAARVANRCYEQAQERVNAIQPPDILPKQYTTTFSTATSEISTFYMVKKEAFDKIMDAIDGNGSFRQLDAKSDEVKEALRDYNDGIAKMALLSIEFGTVYKHQTKKHKKLHKTPKNDNDGVVFPDY